MTNYTITSNLDITNLQLSDGAYRCYMLLQSLCYKDKTTCYPSEKYLACALGRSVRTIQRYIAELVGLNLIIKRRRGSISNLYTLVQKTVNNAIDRLKHALNKREDDSNAIQCDRKQDGTNDQKKTYPKYQKKKNTFNDYTQRKYDYSKLEKGLLGEEDFEFNDLLLE